MNVSENKLTADAQGGGVKVNPRDARIYASASSYTVQFPEFLYLSPNRCVYCGGDQQAAGEVGGYSDVREIAEMAAVRLAMAVYR